MKAVPKESIIILKGLLVCWLFTTTFTPVRCARKQLHCVQCHDRPVICEKQKPKHCDLQTSPDPEEEGGFLGCGIEVEKNPVEIPKARYLCVGEFRLECYRQLLNINVKDGGCVWSKYPAFANILSQKKFHNTDCIQKELEYQAWTPLPGSNSPPIASNSNHTTNATGRSDLHDAVESRSRGKRETVRKTRLEGRSNNEDLSDIKICFCKENGCNLITLLDDPRALRSNSGKNIISGITLFSVMGSFMQYIL